MKNIIWIFLFLLVSCEDKVLEPETKIITTPSICAPTNSETEPSRFSFKGLEKISDITRTSATLHWSHVDGFYQYHIIEIRNKDRVIKQTIDKSKSAITLNDLNPDSTYTFMVRALDSSGFLDTNTETITFNTLPWPNFSNQKSITLNGAQAIELPASNKIGIKKNFTISIWAKLNQSSMQKDARLFTLHRESFATTALSVGISSDKVKLIYSTKTNEVKSILKPTDIFDNQWHHFVLIRKKNKLTLYIDTKKIISTEDKISDLGSHPAFIGSYSGIQKAIIAKIDEFSVFNKSFSFKQVIELNNNNLSMDITEHSMFEKLKIWYQLGDQNQDNSSNIVDVISGQNGKPVNLRPRDFVRDSP